MRCIVKTITKCLVPVMAGLFALNAGPAMAQSTIFNVPSTDTVAKGKVDLRLDWWAQNPNTQGLERLHILNSRIALGVGANIEIGANVPTNLERRV
jgi:hypothetical protein